MKAKIVLILIILLIVLVTVVYAADVKWSALAENTTVADDDVLCIIDTGSGNSQKITVLNFFDTIDTFAELQAITADKTLINEEDTATMDAVITFATNIAFSDAATIDQSANNYIDFTENSDIIQFYFNATDLALIWSDGALNLQNAEDTDAIVNILGKDAGEKGILRVLSDGDDKYTELYHDDTDGYISTSSGDLYLVASGGDIQLGNENIVTDGKIVMTPGGVGSLNAISVIPSAAISTNEASWNSIYIDGTALDPSGDDILLCGVNVDMSGVVFGGTGGDIDGIGINMASGEDHAIHISQGKFVAENTVAATAGAEFTIFDIQVHTATMHANSSIHAIDVATPETPAGTVVAVGTHSNVEVIQQSIGTFTTPNQTEYAGEKHTGGTVWADGVDASEIFVVDDDEVYVGSAAQFGEIDVIMTTPGSKTVTPTFHYNTAADTWTEFFPADDTDGFQQSGIIRWTLADISGSWTNNGDPGGADSSAGYWIKIIRTANADPGTPTPTTVKTGAITSYFWSKTGAVDVLSMEADTITEGGVAVYNDNEIDAFAEIDAIVADKSLINLEDGGTFTGNIIANANLSIGNTTTTAGVLTLLEDDDDGANFASFMVPALGANTVYTLPPDDGDNTEVLQTNGAGTLTWVANAGGGMTSFQAEDGDGTEVAISNAKEWKFIDAAGIDINWTDVSDGTDGDPYDLTFTVALGTTIAAAEMADESHGDMTWAAGAGTVQLIAMNDSATSTYYVTMSDTDGAGASATIYSDTEFTYTEASGTVAATEFSGGGSGLTSVDAITGDSATAFFDAGTIEHEYGGLQANLAAYTGLIGITGADTTVEVDLLSELLTAMGDVTAFITDDDMPAAGADPDIDAAGEIGRDTDGANETGDSSLRGHDGTNQFFYAGKIKTISIPVNNPDGLTAWAGRTNPSQPIWLNTSGMTFTIVEIMAISDVDNYDCSLFESNSFTDVSDENDTLIDALECDADGTEGYTDIETTISHAAIEHDHWIIFEDVLGDAGGVTVIVKGWFNADVD